MNKKYLATLVASLLLFSPCSTQKEEKINPVNPVTQHINQKKEKMEVLLVRWVYENSNQISTKDCILIVKEVMRTGKPLLILSLMQVESRFTINAVSKKGALGLMQIMFESHGQNLIKIGIIKERRDLFDVEPNIKAGNFILDSYLKMEKGNVTKALERYLGGKDGEYLRHIYTNLANLYVLIQNE